jgi:hypothetical protein
VPTKKMRANAAAALCGAIVLGASAHAAPPSPAQSAGVKITQGARTFVPGASVVPIPADLVSTVMVSYDQAGNQPISSPGSTAERAWVHVAVRNMGTMNSPDGRIHRAQFKVVVRFLYARIAWYEGGPPAHYVNEVKEFAYTEALKGGGTYKYSFFADSNTFKNTALFGPGLTRWQPLTIEVKVDASHQISESNEANNDFTYVVHFTD